MHDKDQLQEWAKARKSHLCLRPTTNVQRAMTRVADHVKTACPNGCGEIIKWRDAWIIASASGLAELLFARNLERA